MYRRSFVVGLLGAGLFNTAVRAQVFMDEGGSPDDFRTQELVTGGFALMTSQIAQEQGGEGVREFAPLEIEEQTMIAQELGAAPGSAILPYAKASQLGLLRETPPGPDFDRMYVTGQLIGHRTLLRLNTSYARSGDDEQGRAIAAQSLPIIRKHLAILDRLHRYLMA